jgi:hypothetical protein
MPSLARRLQKDAGPTRHTRQPSRYTMVAWLVVVLGLIPSGPAPAGPAVRLAVIVHPAVPVSTLSAAELASVFTRATRTWKDGTTVRALNLPQNSPERVEFDRVVLDMSPERSAQYWIDKQIRGEEPAPKAIGQADIVVRLISTLRGSIGYVPEDKVDDKVRVVARVRDGKVEAP